jgi:hypothetical protein
MREFWPTYHDDAKLQPMVAEIGWTHNLLIMEKCKALPEGLCDELPSPEQIARLLEGIN